MPQELNFYGSYITTGEYVATICGNEEGFYYGVVDTEDSVIETRWTPNGDNVDDPKYNLQRKVRSAG